MQIASSSQQLDIYVYFCCPNSMACQKAIQNAITISWQLNGAPLQNTSTSQHPPIAQCQWPW
uniref:MIP02579p n=1 Tax=Drosophila melanogaster TaxID=7227 RepID=B8A3Z8_DROME|nr:MIP02579p [Drosophila melanogaster]